MTRRLLLMAVLAALAAVATGSAAGAATEVDASARFTVTIATATRRFTFGQSKITESTLGATPQRPLSLHAAPKSDPLREFLLDGRAKKGEQVTSETLTLALNVEVGDRAMLLISDDGDCTVTVKILTRSRIAGSFTCDTTYGGDDVKAAGTFQAR